MDIRPAQCFKMNHHHARVQTSEVRTPVAVTRRDAFLGLEISNVRPLSALSTRADVKRTYAAHLAIKALTPAGCPDQSWSPAKGNEHRLLRGPDHDPGRPQQNSAKEREQGELK